MALIGKIRKNFWLLVVLMMLALGGFIFMDMTSGQQSVFGSNQTVIGKIEGEKVDWNRFVRTEEILYGNSSGDVFNRRSALWNYFVEETIVKNEAEALGLGVSKTELMDLQFGPTPSPIIQQRFRDPTTNQLNRQQLNEFKNAIQNNELEDPRIRSFWAIQEKEIIKDRLQSKLTAMVSKGMYTPTWMAEMGHEEQNQRVTFSYVKIPFDELDNTEVSVSDEDYRAYLAENAARYERDEATRRLEYTVFDVVPTAEDSAKLRKQIVDLIPEFEATEDDSLFVTRNYGEIDAAYLKKEAVPANIADTVFALPVGSVYGPYINEGAYRAVKVVDRMVVPDSVKSRHILLRVNSQPEYVQALQTIDSLKNLILTGQSAFDSLALAFGTDGTAQKGGDLGYAGPGQMVKPFNDLIFFQAEIGKLYTVETQFGIHLVEVTDKKFIDNEEGVQLAFLNQNIAPSEETQNQLYERVLEFVGQNRELETLRASVEADPELNLETSAPLRRNDFVVGDLGSGQSSRDMVRWAFEQGEVGEVSPEIYIYQDPVDYYNNKYVVAGLKSVQPAGRPDLEDVREEIELQVINRKKGEKLAADIQGMDMGAIAAKYRTQIDTARNVTFSSSFVPNLGAEPKVLAKAFSLAEGQASEPIIGNSGVFVLSVDQKTTPTNPTNIPQLRRTVSANVRAQVSTQLMQAMKKNADIDDNRSRFY